MFRHTHPAHGAMDSKSLTFFYDSNHSFVAMTNIYTKTIQWRNIKGIYQTVTVSEPNSVKNRSSKGETN